MRLAAKFDLPRLSPVVLSVANRGDRHASLSDDDRHVICTVGGKIIAAWHDADLASTVRRQKWIQPCSSTAVSRDLDERLKTDAGAEDETYRGGLIETFVSSGLQFSCLTRPHVMLAAALAAVDANVERLVVDSPLAFSLEWDRYAISVDQVDPRAEWVKRARREFQVEQARF